VLSSLMLWRMEGSPRGDWFGGAVAQAWGRIRVEAVTGLHSLYGGVDILERSEY